MILDSHSMVGRGVAQRVQISPPHHTPNTCNKSENCTVLYCTVLYCVVLCNLRPSLRFSDSSIIAMALT